MIYCAITYVNNSLMSLVPGSCGDLDVLFRQGILPEVDQRLVPVEEACVREDFFVVAPGHQRSVVNVVAS